MMDVIESGKMVVEKYYWGVSDVESVEQQADFESDVVLTEDDRWEILKRAIGNAELFDERMSEEKIESALFDYIKEKEVE